MKRIGSVVVIAALLASLRLFVLSETSFAGPRETGQNQHAEVAPKTGTSVPPNPVAVEAKRRLDANSEKPWRAEWNPTTGTVVEISGESDRSFGDSPKAAATAFLQEYGALFTGQKSTGDGSLSEFRYERMSNVDPRRTTVKFRQHYEDIPVEAGAIVYVAKSGRVLGARSTALYISDLNTTPTISVEDAIESLRRDVAPKYLFASPEKSQGLRILRHTGGARLVFMIYEVFIGKCGPYTAYLDAHSGEVVGLTQDFTSKHSDCDPLRVLDAQPVSPTTPVESEVEPGIETPDEPIDSSESLVVPPPRRVRVTDVLRVARTFVRVSL
jgi:hypothetical protein